MGLTRFGNVVLGVALAVCALSSVTSASVMTVKSDGSHVQTESLFSGVTYTVEIFGTYNYWLPNFNLTDSVWTQDPWVQNSPDWNTLTNSLFIDGNWVSWMGTVDGIIFSPNTFSPSHVYRHSLVGTGQPLDLFISDNNYIDNSGSIQVTVTVGVPEPTSLLATGFGLTCVALMRRRYRATGLATAAS